METTMERASYEPTRPLPLVAVVHVLPRRVRLRSRALIGNPRADERIATELARAPGVSRVSVTPASGSVLLESEDDGGPIDGDVLAARLGAVIARERDDEANPVVDRLSGMPATSRIAMAVTAAI